jgi:ribosomal protein S17E
MEWSHIQARYVKRKGRIPGWYTYIKNNEQKIIDLYNNIIREEYNNKINPFFDLNKEYNVSKIKWITSKKDE